MQLNEYTLNDPPSLNGRAIRLTQAATNIVSIEQIVTYRQSQAATNIVSVEQEVRGRQAATNIVTIEQRVIDPANVAVNTCSWKKPIIHLAGTIVDPGTITGQIEVIRSENNASLATFTVKQACGTIDPDQFQGSSVTIDVDDAGTVKRIYTGIVDIPEVDIIRGRITYRCTDRRRELINNQLSTIKNNIGYYSTHIFGEAKDTFEEVEYRLETVMQSVDFDAFGQYTLTSLNPKASPDYTLTGSQVYRDGKNDPKVELTSRARIINKVNINFGYRYPKLYHWETGYTWEHPDKDTICTYFTSGRSFPSKEMIRQAAKASGWVLNAEPTFTPIWDAGFYRCSGNTIAFTTTVASSDVIPSTDANGDPIVDSNGNTVYTRTNRSFEDSRYMWALGTTFTLSNRWAQTIEEDYSLTINAPQSQSKFGVVEQNARYGLESPFDTVDWESYEAYNNVLPDGNTISGNTIIDKDTNRQEFNTALITALNRAKTTILKSHRDNRVKFIRSMWPEIDLKHTVRLNSNKIDVTGKVSEIRHAFDINNKLADTTVELSFSQSEGSASDTSLSVPSAPTYTASQVVSSVTLGNYYGKDPATTNDSENWTGMIGNQYNYDTTGGITNITLTTFPIYFVVKSPSVQDEARENRTVSTSGSYNVEIPNDSFTVTNGCKC